MKKRRTSSQLFAVSFAMCLAVALLGSCTEDPDDPGGQLADTGTPDAESDMGPMEPCEQQDESSCNGRDSDNDGVIDDGCDCNFNDLSVGVCSDGTIQCDGSCGQPTFYMEEESGENACDGNDNDCDGTTDEVDPVSCELTQGVCSGALKQCNSGRGAYPQTCGDQQYGENYRETERLCDKMDNDCDGEVDEGCTFSILDGTTGDDRLHGADTAPSGAVYAVGESNGGLGESNGGSGTSYDAIVLKYNADGTQAWINNVNTSADDRARGVDVGPNGDIAVVGDSFGDISGEGVSVDGDRDAFVAKYDDSGSQQWISLVRTDQSDSLEDVKVLPDGRVAVVGTTRGEFDSSQSQTGTDAIIAVLSADGENIEWRAQLASDEFAYDAFTELTINDGALFAVGETEGGYIGNAQASSDQGDVVVARYSFDGSLGWLRLFGREASEDKANAVTPVVGQNQTGIWIAGETQATVGDSGTSAGEFDGFLVRIDGSGDARDNFNFGGIQTDRVTGLTVATGGDEAEIYMMGESNSNFLGGLRGTAGFASFITRVSVGVGGRARLDGLWYGKPQTSESELIRRGDGGVIAVGYHRQTEFLGMTPEGGEDYYIIEHRPFPDCFPTCDSQQ